MSVVSSNKVVFCEGKQNSLDYKLLERVLETLPSERTTIVSAGAKFTLAVFAQGFFYPSEIGTQRYLVFRDRDFDVRPTANIQLLQLSNRLGGRFVFLTHRACVENYLIDPILIDSYWQAKYIEKQQNPISRWGHGNSPGVEVISEWIKASARDIQDYQAVRWALGDLLQFSANRSQLKTTWTGKSGKLPNSLDLAFCQTQAIQLITNFIQDVSTVTIDRFEDSLASYQQLFAASEFWRDKQYLIWFNGKDIQKAMQRREPRYIPIESFYNWGISQLDINRHPDLIELQNRMVEL